jgi:PAS domain S-box-containing protein
MQGNMSDIEELAKDPALQPFLKEGVAVLVWRSDGKALLWWSESARPIVEVVAPHNLITEGSSIQHRIALLAAGGAPTRGVRLERLRLNEGVGSDVLTCACHVLVLPNGEKALLTAVIGRLPERLLSVPFEAGSRARMAMSETAISEHMGGSGTRHLSRPVSTPSHSASEITSASAGVTPSHDAQTAKEERLKARAKDKPRWRFVWETDNAGRFTTISDDLVEALGARKEDFVGKTWWDLLGHEVIDPEGIATEAFGLTRTWTVRNIQWRVAGTDLYVLVDLSAVPITDAAGDFCGFRGFGICRLDSAFSSGVSVKTKDEKRAIVDSEEIRETDLYTAPDESKSLLTEPEWITKPAQQKIAFDMTKATSPEPISGEKAWLSWNDMTYGPNHELQEPQATEDGRFVVAGRMEITLNPHPNFKSVPLPSSRQGSGQEGYETHFSYQGFLKNQAQGNPQSQDQAQEQLKESQTPESHNHEYHNHEYHNHESLDHGDHGLATSADVPYFEENFVELDENKTQKVSIQNDTHDATFAMPKTTSASLIEAEEREAEEREAAKLEDEGLEAKQAVPAFQKPDFKPTFEPISFSHTSFLKSAKNASRSVAALQPSPQHVSLDKINAYEGAIGAHFEGEMIATVDLYDEVDLDDDVEPQWEEAFADQSKGLETLETAEPPSSTDSPLVASAAAAAYHDEVLPVPPTRYNPAPEQVTLSQYSGLPLNTPTPVEDGKNVAEPREESPSIHVDDTDAALMAYREERFERHKNKKPKPQEASQQPLHRPISVPLPEEAHQRIEIPVPTSLRTQPPSVKRTRYSLSVEEKSTFREIARVLGGKKISDPSEKSEQNTSTSPLTEPTSGNVAPFEAAPPLRTSPKPRLIKDYDPGFGMVLDRLPVGVLILRGTSCVYANQTFLDLVGYRTIETINGVGGIDHLFTGRIAEDFIAHDEDDEARSPLEVITASGERLGLDSHLSMISWQGQPATLMSFRKRLSTAPEMARLKALEIEHIDTLKKVHELSAILDTATDGVVVVDDKGRILSMNRSAEALFGYDQKEVVGETFTLLMAGESHALALDYLEGLKSHGVASLLNDGREVMGRVRQGGHIPLFITLGALAHEGSAEHDTSRTQGAKSSTTVSVDRTFCAVIRDLSSWKKAEQELLEAKKEAEKSSAQKSDFLAKMSHEIRTPLNAILGFTEVIRDERFGTIGNERYKEYIQDIYTSGEHLISLVNDLLDLAKIEAGHADLHFEAIDVNAALEAGAHLLNAHALREHVVVRTSLAPKLPQVVADDRAVKQIILNVLSNAIKFTPEGGQVILSTELMETGEVVFRIRDTGIGMSDADVKDALEPFRQIATSRRSGGTGLGLPLTKALVEANRAAFEITSIVGEGTLVEVTFPPTRVLAS